MGEKKYKILACVDLSQYSLITLTYALKFAQSTQACIIVFSVINQKDFGVFEMVNSSFPDCFPPMLNMEDYIGDLKEERRESLKQLIEENYFDETSRLSIKIDVGIPFVQILMAVEKEKIDLIVMANKGRGNLSRFLFGSTAEKVFRHSPVPVVSVRDQEKFKRRD
jgi:nucleotide-binding universal stress UspA family protein